MIASENPLIENCTRGKMSHMDFRTGKNAIALSRAGMHVLTGSSSLESHRRESIVVLFARHGHRNSNIDFYASAAAAQEAAFRSCLPCRPEIAPELSAWRGTSNTVSQPSLSFHGALSIDQEMASRNWRHVWVIGNARLQNSAPKKKQRCGAVPIET